MALKRICRRHRTPWIRIGINWDPLRLRSAVLNYILQYKKEFSKSFSKLRQPILMMVVKWRHWSSVYLLSVWDLGSTNQRLMNKNDLDFRQLQIQVEAIPSTGLTPTHQNIICKLLKIAAAVKLWQTLRVTSKSNQNYKPFRARRLEKKSNTSTNASSSRRRILRALLRYGRGRRKNLSVSVFLFVVLLGIWHSIVYYSIKTSQRSIS